MAGAGGQAPWAVPGAPDMIVGPNSVILGYILKSIPNSDFRMTDFDDRLRLQKLIYMVEAFGVYLGYDFSWFLRGPYCTNLARTGFELEQLVDSIPDDAKARFLDKGKQKRFDRCVNFIRSIMDGPRDLDRLEIAASVHLLAQNPRASQKDVFERVVSKIPGNAGRRAELLETCQKMWDALSANSLLPDRASGTPAADDRAPKPPQAVFRLEKAPESMDAIKDAMIERQQYGDAAIAVTLKDLHEHRADLEPNERPAFMRRPNEIEPLVPDSAQDALITKVLRQYG